jgi:hypothetical protein
MQLFAEFVRRRVAELTKLVSRFLLPVLHGICCSH